MSLVAMKALRMSVLHAQLSKPVMLFVAAGMSDHL